MKQRVEVKEKPLTSSLNICPETCFYKGVGGVTPPPLATILFPADLVGVFHLKTT
jgi:hypothetical protein